MSTCFCWILRFFGQRASRSLRCGLWSRAGRRAGARLRFRWTISRQELECPKEMRGVAMMNGVRRPVSRTACRTPARQEARGTIRRCLRPVSFVPHALSCEPIDSSCKPSASFAGSDNYHLHRPTCSLTAGLSRQRSGQRSGQRTARYISRPPIPLPADLYHKLSV